MHQTRVRIDLSCFGWLSVKLTHLETQSFFSKKNRIYCVILNQKLIFELNLWPAHILCWLKYFQNFSDMWEVGSFYRRKPRFGTFLIKVVFVELNIFFKFFLGAYSLFLFKKRFIFFGATTWSMWSHRWCGRMYWVRAWPITLWDHTPLFYAFT